MTISRLPCDFRFSGSIARSIKSHRPAPSNARTIRKRRRRRKAGSAGAGGEVEDDRRLRSIILTFCTYSCLCFL
ncbi:hypothetical protein K402DRAFT_174284 [Aulographum hederae CBS 113979]|uniref:Uncharacterized protein n=1 Tax=Aulographum hederae CBS 113979 TaxID=1176131 RepID=A0A6G1HDN7_9PEZI|nr:hypothetical protein K402DRAFT_174284 [Aulographum hederae CBS 113979]